MFHLLISFVLAMLFKFFPQILIKRSFALAFTHFHMVEALLCLKVGRSKRFFPRTPMWEKVTARKEG